MEFEEDIEYEYYEPHKINGVGEEALPDYTYHETYIDVYNNCVVLSCASILPVIVKLLLPNFFLGLLSCCGFLHRRSLHMVTMMLGGCLIERSLRFSNSYSVVVVVLPVSLLLVYFTYFLRRKLHIKRSLLYITIFFIVFCEYFFIDREAWSELRGVLMVVSMKLICVGDSLQHATQMPDVWPILGYLYSSPNILLGPWISFEEYLSFINTPRKKNIWWMLSLIQVTAQAVLFLTLSNCWATYFIPAGYNKWAVAFREAFVFRTSHYFVSYLAESGMIAAGFTRTDRFRYEITDPLAIEFPSSLSMVVKKWNQPMHEFLKKYIYKASLPSGDEIAARHRFLAIFLTFFMSSLFHGFEIKITMILISLGVFSFMQVSVRNRLAEYFDMCCKVRPCRECSHQYKRSSFVTKFVLFLFGLKTVVHLAYLGVLMDESTDRVGIYKKWLHLIFLSHLIMIFDLFAFT